MTRVIFDPEPEPDEKPYLEQPAMFAGIYPECVGQQGTLFDLGRPARKPAPLERRADQPEMF